MGSSSAGFLLQLSDSSQPWQRPGGAFLLRREVRRCMVFDGLSSYHTRRHIFDDPRMRHQNVRKRGPVACGKGVRTARCTRGRSHWLYWQRGGHCDGRLTAKCQSRRKGRSGASHRGQSRGKEFMFSAFSDTGEAVLANGAFAGCNACSKTLLRCMRPGRSRHSPRSGSESRKGYGKRRSPVLLQRSSSTCG